MKSRLNVSAVWGLTTRPGPDTYRPISSGFGNQVSSTKRSHKGFGFGGEKRDGSTWNATFTSAGPGSFAHEVSMGKQITSKRPTTTRAHFGTSTREHSAIQYNAWTYKPT